MSPMSPTIEDDVTDENSAPAVDDARLRWQAHRVLMSAFHEQQVPQWLADRLAAGLGSVCLFGSNLTGDDEQARALIADLHAAAPEGTLVTLDEEGGDVTRLDAVRGSEVAGHAALGAVDDVALTESVGTNLGRRLRDLGVDLDLGPVADVNCEPDNPVIGVRSFGADPQLVGRHVAAFVEGLQLSGVAACVKHFPGHGATVEDSHLAAPRLDIDADTLRARELVPFAAAVRAGTAAVMTSHVVVTAVDPERPATTSPSVVALLRDELGFDGVLVADALDMAGVVLMYGSAGPIAVAALAAGVDLLCLGPDRLNPDRTAGVMEGVTGEVVEAIVAAVHDGSLSAERLAEAAGRVETLIGRMRPLPSRRSTQPRPEPIGTPADGSAPPLNLGLTPAGQPDPNPIAAARALRIEHIGPPAAAPVDAVVVEFDVTPGIAAGVVPWGLAGPLSALLTGIERRPARESDSDAGVFDHLRAAEPGRPLIAVVRDAHRHAWVREQLTELATARPDLITVETGWPVVDDQGDPAGLPGATRIWTYGGSAVSLRAAAELLAGLPPELSTDAPDRGTP
jgi:beta-N-acetylhexosaminidase